MASVGAKVAVDTSGITGVVSEAKTRNVTLKGVRAGIKVLLPAARAGAPRRKGSGALRQAQGTRAAKGRKGKTLSFAVQGARTKVVKYVTPPGHRKPVKAVPAFYDHLVQGGTRPHRLGKGERLARAPGSKRKDVAQTAQATGGRHPGTKPDPYRKRAYESLKGEIGQACTAAMAAELQKVITREAAKMGAK